MLGSLVTSDKCCNCKQVLGQQLALPVQPDPGPDNQQVREWQATC